MAAINGIHIKRMTESCARTTYYVDIISDEGFVKTVEGHKTGHFFMQDGERVEVPGLSIEEARDRALIDANTWADFLGLTLEPYEEDGVVHSASMAFHTYTMRREMSARRTAKQAEGQSA